VLGATPLQAAEIRRPPKSATLGSADMTALPKKLLLFAAILALQTGVDLARYFSELAEGQWRTIAAGDDRSHLLAKG
jgi:uncharacterized membrane protein